MMLNSYHSIKGYELRERVGVGASGAVYRAYQASIGREVAIKVILPEYANQPDFVRRFEVEAQLIAQALGNRATLKFYPGLGHALSPVNSPATDDFGAMVQQPIDDMAAWILATK